MISWRAGECRVLYFSVSRAIASFTISVCFLQKFSPQNKREMNFSWRGAPVRRRRTIDTSHNHKSLFLYFTFFFFFLFESCVWRKSLSRHSKWKHRPLVYELSDGAVGSGRKCWNGSRSFFFFYLLHPDVAWLSRINFALVKTPQTHHARTVVAAIYIFFDNIERWES